MSDALIRIALEKRLATMTTPPPTIHENENLPPPTEGSAYQRADLLPAQPENPEVGSGPFKRLSGIFQITLLYPLGDGIADVAARAELVRTTFPRGLSLTEQGVTVTVASTPYIMAGFRDDEYWCVPVRVSYFANI